MIVIDAGCQRYGNDYSLERLVEEFHPNLLFAFDPNLSDIFEERIDEDFDFGRTNVVFNTAAVHTYDGEIGFVRDGLGSWTTTNPEARQVRCIYIAKFIRSLPS